MSFTDNINGIPAQDTVLRQGIATLRNTVISNTIKPLTANQNGVYTADPNNGTYGYSPVTVDTGVYTGATAPDNSLGKDGDYYYQISKTRYGIKSVDNSGMTVSPMRILANEFYVTGAFKLTGIRINLSEAVNVKYYVLDNTKTVVYESDSIQGAVGWNEHTLTTPISLVYNQHYIIAANVQDKGTYTQNGYTIWNTEYVIFVRDLYSQTDNIGGLVNDSVTCMVDPVLETDNDHVVAEYIKDNDAWVSISGTNKMILSSLSATENRTYNAPTGTAYSSVTVNVPSSGGGTGLPTGYTAIEYIECPASGQAGFVLENLTIDAYDVIEFLTMPYEVPSSDEAAFAGIEDMYEFYYNDGSALVWVDGSEIMVFDYQERPVAVANTQYYHKSLPTDYYTGDFAVGYYSLGNYQFKGRIYKFKIHRNSDMYHDIATVYDFRPCTRDSDGKVGMYDIVNDVFYSSTTGTEFVAPPSNN